MRIKFLRLSNIRSYHDLSLDFPDGAILFQGDIGSGKSTILMAIEFALFGLGSLSPDALLAKGERRGEVVLGFEVDSTTYEVYRTLTLRNDRIVQDAKNTFLRVEGIQEPLTASDLKPRILQILNFNEPSNPRSHSRVYRYAVYTPQEEIKDILYGSRREETIRKAFGMEDYKTALDNAVLVKSKMDNKIGILRERFADADRKTAELQDVTARIKSQQSNIKSLEEEKSRLDSAKTKWQDKLDGITNRVSEFEGLQRERADITRLLDEDEARVRRHQEDIKSCNAAIHERQNAIKSYNKPTQPTKLSGEGIDGLYRTVLDAGRVVETKLARWEQSQQDVKRLAGRLGGRSPEQVHTEARRLEDAVSLGETKSHNITKDIAQKRETAGSIANEIATLKTALGRAESLEDRCEYCDRPLDISYVERLVAERQSSLAGALAHSDAINDDIAGLDAHLRDVEKTLKHDRLALVKSTHDKGLIDSLAEKQSDSKLLERELVKARALHVLPLQEGFEALPGETPEKYVERLKGVHAAYEVDMRRLADLHKEVSSLKVQLQQSSDRCAMDVEAMNKRKDRREKIDLRLPTYDTIMQERQDATTRFNDVSKAFLTISGQLEAERARRDSAVESQERLKEELAEAQRQKAEHDRYEDHREWLLEYFVPSVKKIEEKAMNVVRRDFDEFYRRWYSILVEDGEKTSMIDEGFGPVLYQNNYELSIDHLSGGEKTGVALAYRLALNSTMRRQTDSLRSNLLILDEPTDGFSRDQMERVRQVIRELDSEQIIMVSHERELEDYVDHVFRVAKTDGISTVTTIVQ